MRRTTRSMSSLGRRWGRLLRTWRTCTRSPRWTMSCELAHRTQLEGPLTRQHAAEGRRPASQIPTTACPQETPRNHASPSPIPISRRPRHPSRACSGQRARPRRPPAQTTTSTWTKRRSSLRNSSLPLVAASSMHARRTRRKILRSGRAVCACRPLALLYARKWLCSGQ